MNPWIFLIVVGLSVVFVGVFITLIFTSMAAKHAPHRGTGGRKARSAARKH